MLFSTIEKLAVFFVVVFAAASHITDWSKTQVLVVRDEKIAPEDDVLAQLFQLNENYQLSVVDYSDDDLALFLGDDALYNHVVFLPSKKRLSPAKQLVNKHKLVEFFNKGGNVIAIGSHDNVVPDEVRAFISQLGIHPAPKGYQVDNYFTGGVKIDNENVVSQELYGNLDSSDYVGSAALLSNSELVFPLVKAPKLSFTANPKDEVLNEEKTWTVGEQGFLAAAAQGLNSARGAWFGSLDLLNDDIISWVFQERGVLKLQFVEHYKTEKPNVRKTLYRVGDEVYYTIGLSEYKNGDWVPFVPQGDDQVVQLAFKMLDPYQRLNLTLLGPGASEENGKNDLSIFYAQFKIPDHHGMFTFELDYKRQGLTFIEDKRVVTVRHLANDEYRRSWDITNSWLYVASASAVIVAWFFFVANFLFLGSPTSAAKVEKKSEKAVKPSKAEKVEKVEKVKKSEE